VIHGKAPGERLHIQRLRFARRVRLARVLPRLRTGHVLGARQGKKGAQLGAVNEEGRREHPLRSITYVLHSDGLDAVAAGLRRHRRLMVQHGELTGAHVGSQHPFENG
jgi:hypothetical protein